MVSDELLYLVREEPEAARSLADKAEPEFEDFIRRVIAEVENGKDRK